MEQPFTWCPGEDCDVPADILERYVLESSEGPIEHVRVECLNGHYYNLPAYMLPEADNGQ